MWPNPQFPADLIIFTEEILNGKLRFLYSVYSEHCQISEMECFAKKINSFTLLIISAKQSILDILQGSKYASESIQ